MTAGTAAAPANAATNGHRAVFTGAAAVLARNWHGLHTLPATGLYPHQWSWDSAFIAIGLRHLSPRRAAQEMESLFGGQWHDGRIPQIVFDPARDDDYSPGAAFWQSNRICGAPAVPTAGLIQPPNHAWAVLLVHQADPAESIRRSFLARMYPKLVAWHQYLRLRRTRGGGALACILHPWESGMDNAPAWDAVLRAVTHIRQAEDPRTSGSTIPRLDLLHTEAAERPTDAEYSDYLYLAGRYRDHDCDDLDDKHPFQVEDPAFNALWAASESALAVIAEEIGLDGSAHLQRAAEITAALDDLFDDELGLLVPRDVQTGKFLRHGSISGLVPLILGNFKLASRLQETLHGPRFALGRAVLVPSYDLTSPEFRSARYWRGPSWFNTSWLIVQGLHRHGAHQLAKQLAEDMCKYALTSDFAEYLDPLTGQPHGTRSFSWTAALALDAAATLRTRPESPK